MTKPICTKDHPAPKGEPIVPGWTLSHAHPDWEHPYTRVEKPEWESAFSEGPDDHLLRTVFCNFCNGFVRQYKAELK